MSVQATEKYKVTDRILNEKSIGSNALSERDEEYFC